jgi:hypothetical protein
MKVNCAMNAPGQRISWSMILSETTHRGGLYPGRLNENVKEKLKLDQRLANRANEAGSAAGFNLFYRGAAAGAGLVLFVPDDDI